MIAIIGTSDRPCWLAEACKILLLFQIPSLPGCNSARRPVRIAISSVRCVGLHSETNKVTVIHTCRGPSCLSGLHERRGCLSW